MAWLLRHNQSFSGAPNSGINRESSLLAVATEAYTSFRYSCTIIFAHLFTTAFFMLWTLSAELMSKQIVASKFLHVIFPFLVFEWWLLVWFPFSSGSSSSHSYLYFQTLRPSTASPSPFLPPPSNYFDSSVDPVRPHHQGAMQRDLVDVMRRQVIKISAAFAILLIIDLVYLGVVLIPTTVTCATHLNTGESLPIECSEWRDYRYYRHHHQQHPHTVDASGGGDTPSTPEASPLHLSRSPSAADKGPGWDAPGLPSVWLFIITIAISVLHVILSALVIYTHWTFYAHTKDRLTQSK